MNFSKNRKKIIAFIAAFLFLGITFFLLSGKLETIDNIVTNYILSIRNPNLTTIMIIITNICSLIGLLIISTFIFLFIKNKKFIYYIIINLMNSLLLSFLFKNLIRRQRPIEINLIEVSGFSYPSGHSIVSMAFFGLLAYLVYKSYTNKATKITLISTLLLITILIGFSRIYLGVHYFSDVLGGFLISTSYLMFFIITTKLYKH